MRKIYYSLLIFLIAVILGNFLFTGKVLATVPDIKATVKNDTGTIRKIPNITVSRENCLNEDGSNGGGNACCKFASWDQVTEADGIAKWTGWKNENCPYGCGENLQSVRIKDENFLPLGYCGSSRAIFKIEQNEGQSIERDVIVNDCKPVAGRVTGCTTLENIANLNMTIVSNRFDSINQGEITIQTNKDGYFSYPRLWPGYNYAVRVKGDNIPLKYSSSPKTTTTSWSWNVVAQRDTLYDEGSYEYQQFSDNGQNGCAGPDGNGVWGRCNFCLKCAPCQPGYSPEEKTCECKITATNTPTPSPIPTPLIPNCSNLSAPENMNSGVPATIQARYFNGPSLSGNFTFRKQEDDRSDVNETPYASVVSGQSMTTSWTPTSSGDYDVCCSASNTRGKCYGASWIGTPVCTGPTTCRVVHVADSAGWFQVIGGDAYAKNNISVQTPSKDVSFNINNPLNNSTRGISYYGGTYSTGYTDNRGLNSNDSTFKETNKITYSQILNEFPNIDGLISADESRNLNPPPNIGSLGNTKVYLFKGYGNPSHVNSSWSNLGTTNMVIFIENSDLYIDASTITVPSGSFIAFVGSGNIIFSPTAQNIQGVYIAGKQIITNTSSSSSTDTQLTLEGTFAGLQGFSLQRNLKTLNSTTPAEKFVFRPDFAFTAPERLKKPFKFWKEMNP